MKVELIDYMGSDDSVANAARVSFHKSASQYTAEQNAKLIRYLAKHKHWTPFAQVAVTLRLNAPIAIHAQCVKHQIGFAMNTVSRRYVNTLPELFVPQWRTKPEGSVKQGSGGAHPDAARWQQAYRNHCERALQLYRDMIDEGIAAEQARFILPQGVMTEWMWTGSLAAWARFYMQRTDAHAQKEIQILARLAGEHIAPLYPISWAALTERTHD